MHHPKIQEMIDEAETDLARLTRAKTARAAKRAWIDFLDHSNRALNRLETPARRAGRLAEYKDLLTAIWGHPVAGYMRTARNALEHGVAEFIKEDPKAERIVFETGAILGSPTITATDEHGDQYVVAAAAGPVEVSTNMAYRRVALTSHLALAPVNGAKGQVSPPAVILISEDEAAAAAIARVHLAWVKQTIEAF